MSGNKPKDGLLTVLGRPAGGGGGGGAAGRPPPHLSLVFLRFSQNILRNPYLKILDLTKKIIADDPIKKSKK